MFEKRCHFIKDMICFSDDSGSSSARCLNILCRDSSGERIYAAVTVSYPNSSSGVLYLATPQPYNGPGKGPRLHDIRHTFAVHCLNNWVLSGEELTAALPVLSRYLGHNGLTGTQKYLQLTAQMYPDIVAKLETQFGGLIPQMEVADENI